MSILAPLLRTVLCLYLLLWEPLNVASEALQAWPTLEARGVWAVVELTVHAIFAMMAVAGALALWHRVPHAGTLATLGLLASTARIIQVTRFSVLPHDISPDMRWALALVAIAHFVFWASLLARYSEQLTGHPSDRQA